MLVIAEKITRIYNRGQEKIYALRDGSLQIQAGAFVYVTGPSGGGKSTLLHLLGGMDRPDAGHLSVNGFALEKASEEQLTHFRRDNIGFVFQFFNLISSLSALENVMLPQIARGIRAREAQKNAAALLDQLGLASRVRHRPAELSGGEQQRVAIARAIIGSPALVLADEPTGDLDQANAEAIIKLMRDLNAELRITFVVATHNKALVDTNSQVLELRDGVIKES